MTLRVGLEYQQSIGTHDVKYISNETDKGSGLRDGELILQRVKNKNKESAHDRGNIYRVSGPCSEQSQSGVCNALDP